MSNAQAAARGGARAAGALATARAAVRAGGGRVLWSGLSPTLIMALPGSVVFFVAYAPRAHSRMHLPDGPPIRHKETDMCVAACRYEELRAAAADNGAGPVGSAFAGGTTARALTVLAASPLDLLRTQRQYEPSRLGVWRGLAGIVRGAGLRGLWRGASATLARDIPFSAIYWASFEGARGVLTDALAARRAARSHATGGGALAAAPGGGGHAAVDEWAVAFGAGALAGGLAAFATTPLDVVKTRRQVGLDASGAAHPRGYSMRRELAAIAASGGVRGLFAGLGPRLAKIAPACAVMISSYECVKRYMHAPS